MQPAHTAHFPINLYDLLYHHGLEIRAQKASKTKPIPQYILMATQESKIQYFFTYKPSNFFQYLTQKFGRFFHEKRGSAYSRGFGIQKQLQIQYSCKMNVNSKYCSALLKLSWQQPISDHQSDSLLPTHWKTIALNLAKLFSFHTSNKIFGFSALKTTAHLLVWFEILGSETAHFLDVLQTS